VDPFAVGGHRHKGRWASNYLKRWIPKILKTFRGVQALTLVVQHYSSEANDDQPSFCFMEPIDIDNAHDDLNDYQGYNGEWRYGPELRYLSYAEVDEKAIEAERVRKNMYWKRPTIQYQICLTEKAKREYENA